jgi:integrase
MQKKAIFCIVAPSLMVIILMKSAPDAEPPTTVNLTVKRRYLTEREIERLMDCARKRSRHGHRDATMILVTYRHGLRAAEVCDLQWHQIELNEGRLHVHRVKAWDPQRASHSRRRDASPAQASARTPDRRLCVRFGARRADQPAWLPSAHGKARQDRRNAL